MLGELRAYAAVYGPLALVLLDAHVDTADEYYGQRYFHGTPLRRAVEEGLLAPERSVMAGMRGSTYDDAEWDAARSLGFTVIPCEELRDWTADRYGELVRGYVEDRPAFLSFDIDVIDPPALPRAPARRRQADYCPTRHSASCARSPVWTFVAMTWSRFRRSWPGPVSRRRCSPPASLTSSLP